MTAMQQRDFPIGGHCGIPPTARSVAFNVTVTASTDSGHLQLYPSGSPPPATSTINWGMGQTRANNAILALGASGSVTAFCVILPRAPCISFSTWSGTSSSLRES